MLFNPIGSYNIKIILVGNIIIENLSLLKTYFISSFNIAEMKILQTKTSKENGSWKENKLLGFVVFSQ